MKDVKQLIQEASQTNPGRMSEIAVELSAWYATLSEQLENILVFKADRWVVLRDSHNSDRATDRAWDATDEGKQEIRLRSQLKYLEKFISSLKLRLKIKEGESFGRYQYERTINKRTNPRLSES